MAAPLNISVCIDDINKNLLPKNSGNFPIHIPSMGNRGGSGCDIISANVQKKEIVIKYRNFPLLTICQGDYFIFAERFNKLQASGATVKGGRLVQHAVNRYNAPKWQNNPFGQYCNPLLPSIFKVLNY